MLQLNSLMERRKKAAMGGYTDAVVNESHFSAACPGTGLGYDVVMMNEDGMPYRI